jgi:hypothetical protein
MRVPVPLNLLYDVGQIVALRGLIYVNGGDLADVKRPTHQVVSRWDCQPRRNGIKSKLLVWLPVG